MTKPHKGGPAFPSDIEMSDGTYWYESGMTLRDWFAGQFDATDVVKFNTLEDAAEFLGEECPDIEDMEAMIWMGIKVQAKLRYMLADAMLEHSKGDENDWRD